LSFGNIRVNGVPVDPVLYQNTLYRAQSTYFVTLVLMQWANLLMTRTRRLSIFQQPPIGPKETRNLYIFLAMLFTLSVLVMFVFVPFFQDAFHTRGVMVQYWFIRMSSPGTWVTLALGFGLGLLTLDEMRKFFVRRYPKGFLATIAW
jgi:sodium/potassium-transporting ATPase subunit alpha